jgi:flagellar protein FliS
MTSNAALRNLYMTESVQTMSPARAVVALYDRLVLDLERAMNAIATKDGPRAHDALVHAQEIVAELHDSLDLSQWAPGAALAELYRFVHSELVAANLAKDPSRVDTCVRIVTPLRDTWREAAGIVGTPKPGEQRA